MTTLKISPLPIPDDTVQGTGSYTIPANKYAYLSAYASASAAGSAYNDLSTVGPGGGSGAGSSTSIGAWLVAGDSISTSNSSASTSSSGMSRHVSTSGYGRVLVNGSDLCRANATGHASNCGRNGSSAQIVGSSTSGWSVSLYPIPKNNLPEILQEGN